MDQQNDFPAWDLLTEIPLRNILDFLPLDDLKNVRSVSQRWSDLAESVFVQKSTLVLEFCAIHPKLPPWNFLTRSKLKFENVQIGKQLCPIFDEKEFGGQLGESVQHLIMKEGQKKHLSSNFLLHFKQLISIYFEDWEDFLYFEIPEWIENIKIDTVAAVMVKSEKDKFEMTLKLPKLKTFTAKQVQRASEDTLWFNKGNEEQFDIIYCSPDVKGIYHRIQIEPINFCQTKSIEDTNILGIVFKELALIPSMLRILLKLPNLQFLRLQEFNGCLNFHLDELKLNHVKSLNIINLMEMFVLTHYHRNPLSEEPIPPCQQCMENLIKNCTNIETFESLNFHHAQNYFNAISKAVKSITLNNMDLILQTPETSSIFHKLQKVSIVGNVPPIPRGDFVKFLKLCPALKEIFLKCISFEEILMIENTLPDLSVLHFEKIKSSTAQIENLINGLQGKFKKLRILGEYDYHEEHFYVPNKGKWAKELFEKIPTLRRSFFINFDEFCTDYYSYYY